MAKQQQSSSQPSIGPSSSATTGSGPSECGICGHRCPRSGELTRHVQLVHNVVQFMCDFQACGAVNNERKVCWAMRQNSDAVNGRSPDGTTKSGANGRESHHRHVFDADDPDSKVNWRPQPENNWDMFAVFPTVKKWAGLAASNPFGLGESEAEELKRMGKKTAAPEYIVKLRADRAMYRARDQAALGTSGGVDSLLQPESDATSSNSSQDGVQGPYETALSNQRPSLTESWQHMPSASQPLEDALSGGPAGVNVEASSGPMRGNSIWGNTPVPRWNFSANGSNNAPSNVVGDHSAQFQYSSQGSRMDTPNNYFGFDIMQPSQNYPEMPVDDPAALPYYTQPAPPVDAPSNGYPGSSVGLPTGMMTIPYSMESDLFQQQQSMCGPDLVRPLEPLNLDVATGLPTYDIDFESNFRNFDEYIDGVSGTEAQSPVEPVNGVNNFEGLGFDKHFRYVI